MKASNDSQMAKHVQEKLRPQTREWLSLQGLRTSLPVTIKALRIVRALADPGITHTACLTRCQGGNRMYAIWFLWPEQWVISVLPPRLE